MLNRKASQAKQRLALAVLAFNIWQSLARHVNDQRAIALRAAKTHFVQSSNSNRASLFEVRKLEHCTHTARALHAHSLMRILIIGATGGIGKQVLEQAVANANIQEIRAMVRSPSKLAELAKQCDKVKVIALPDGGIGSVSVQEMAEHVSGCDAVLLCLGHELNLKGVFMSGMLVLEANKLICSAIGQSDAKFIQVNSIGVSSPDGSDLGKRGLGTRVAMSCIAAIGPPFKDSMLAAQFMHDNKTVKNWCVVRPDGLLDAPKSEFQVLPTLKWSLFHAKTTNRANCAAFMLQLCTDDAVWQQWRGKFPIVLNKD